MGAFEAAAGQGLQDRLDAELQELFRSQNTASIGTEIPATFLRVDIKR
jgi:hypothetical protein